MYKKNLLFIFLILSCFSFGEYTEKQNKDFINETVKIMNYAFPIEMNGLKFDKVKNIENTGILFPLIIMEDVSESESAFMEKMMTNMMVGLATEACTDPSMTDIFKRDLMIIYNFKDIDGSMDFELIVDNSYCNNE